MKHLHHVLIIPIIVALVLLALQQSCAQVEMPVPSPAASISQTVGVTNISISYSSPAVRGRVVWGGLVPYGEMWRTGANSPTKVKFSTDVKVQGKDVKAGEYTLITIPTKDKWTVILNKDSKGNGVFSYLESDDVIRVEATPKTAEMREYLGFMITPLSDDKAHIVIHWEKIQLPIEITTDTKANAVASIESGMGIYDRAWYDYASAAEYYVQNDLDIEKAATWAMLSTKLRTHFYNQWVMAQVEAKKGNFGDALKYAQEANKMGKENGGGFYEARKEAIETAIAEWTKKTN